MQARTHIKEHRLSSASYHEPDNNTQRYYEIHYVLLPTRILAKVVHKQYAVIEVEIILNLNLFVIIREHFNYLMRVF
jgi:hypothetical protein